MKKCNEISCLKYDFDTYKQEIRVKTTEKSKIYDFKNDMISAIAIAICQ